MHYYPQYSGQDLQIYHHAQAIKLESGIILPNVDIGYHTYGRLNAQKDNVIWICHAFSANSDVLDWWPNMVGDGLVFDTRKHFIICANVLGSCYGTTGALSFDAAKKEPYYRDFPQITIRDMVNVHQRLCDYLGIHRIKTLVGGSIGGFQALEWAIISPENIQNLIFAAASVKTSPWVIANNEAQRMAIEADASFWSNQPKGGEAGLRAARAMALLSYRNYDTYNATQKEGTEEDKTHDFRASSYQRYQGKKLSNRFNAYSYYHLTQAIDSFNIGRGRGGVENALRSVQARTLSIGISSDKLFRPEEQRYLSQHIAQSQYAEVESPFGHDGFLIEQTKIAAIISEFLHAQ
ncbi:MAG: homoserine O-acetyltransferase MetX [Bacteroidales bacterium]